MADNSQHHLILSDCRVDLVRRVAIRTDEQLKLSTLEARLLGYLVDRSGTDVSTYDLLSDVWGYREVVETSAVYCTVRRLRMKIEADPTTPRHLLTVHGTGYRFEPLVQDVRSVPPSLAPAEAQPQASRVLRVGEQSIDLSLQRGGGPRGDYVLSAQECHLLDLLQSAGERPVSRAELLRKVWQVRGSGQTRAVDNAVHRLREKIETDPKAPEHLQTVRGVGYRLVGVRRQTALTQRSLVAVLVEGIVPMLEQRADQVSPVLEKLDELVQEYATEHGGRTQPHGEGGGFAVFGTLPQALAFATEMQTRAHAMDWGVDFDADPVLRASAGTTRLHRGLRLKMGVHTGVVTEGRARGLAAVVVTALAEVAQGGQILVTETSLPEALDDSHNLTDLGLLRLPDQRTEQVWDVAVPGVPPRDFVATRDVGTRLPPAGVLYGREPLIEEVVELVEGAERLVTLVGPGGIGKTAVGAAVAHELANRGEDVGFVNCAEVVGADDFVSAVASGLGLAGVTTQPALQDAVRGRRLVLVLDNLEQFAEARVALGDVMQASPHLKVVATSRTELGLVHECLRTVGPLSVPQEAASVADASHSPAVSVLVRAASRRRRFELDDTNAAPVVALVRHLGGWPLALELAGARLQAMDPSGLLAELRRATSTLSARKAGDRRSLSAVLDWSWGQLDEPLREALIALAQFSGLVPVAVAVRLVGSHDAIDALASAGLAVVRNDDFGKFWVRLMPPVREYVRAKTPTSQGPELRERVAHTLVVAFVDWCPRRWHRSAVAWMDFALRGPHLFDDVLACARERIVAKDWVRAGELTIWLCGLAEGRPVADVVDLIDCIDTALLPPATRLAADLIFAHRERNFGRIAAASDRIDRALDLAVELGDLEAQARAHLTRKVIRAAVGQPEGARQSIEEVAVLVPQLEPSDLQLLFQLSIADTWWALGRHDAIPDMFGKVEQQLRERVITNLDLRTEFGRQVGRYKRSFGDFAGARAVLQQALSDAQTEAAASRVIEGLAYLDWAEGDPRSAADRFVQAAEHARRCGGNLSASVLTVASCYMLTDLGQMADAERLALQVLREPAGSRSTPVVVASLLARIHASRGEFELADARWATVREVDLDGVPILQSVAAAGLSWIAFHRGELDQAKNHYGEATTYLTNAGYVAPHCTERLYLQSLSRALGFGE